jgi:hypothetical protein
MVMFLSNQVGHLYGSVSRKENTPGSSSNNLLIFALSSSGFGPKPNCDIVEGPDRADSIGVPARELFVEVETLFCCELLRALGGADIGRVDICNGGSGFPFACGNNSSRLTGIPRDMRCCWRIRERVQFGGFVGGGEWNSVL